MDIKFTRAEKRDKELLISALKGKEHLQEKSKQLVQDDMLNMLALCDKYHIKQSHNMWYELALSIARECYPEPQKKGRKSKWNGFKTAVLVVELERLIDLKNPSKGVQWASKQLAKKEPWKSFIEFKDSNLTSPDPAETIRKIYFDFKDDEWSERLRLTFKKYEVNQDLEGWEEFVKFFEFKN
ncbi:MAG: hypothetical protein HOO93_03010 [Methyloglobulus sp.]|nr:hypothetical protein [Methyloglobulus sp.]